MKIQFKTTVLLLRRKSFFFLVFILQLVACSLWGQVLQKKTLTAEDYPKWGRLAADKISANGQWISYQIRYENGLDTLFLKNTKSLKTQAFPLGNGGDFITPNWFSCQTAEGLHLVNLTTDKQETLTNVTQYAYVPTANQLLLLITQKGKENLLLIRKLDGTPLERIAGVNEFIMDPAKQMVLYTTTTTTNKEKQHTIALLELSKKNRKTVLLNGADPFCNLVWHTKGKAVAFMQKAPDSSPSGSLLFCYKLSSKKLYRSNYENQYHFLGDSLFIPTVGSKLKISDDLQKIFFTAQLITKSNDSIKDSDVQLWNGNAKQVYPMKEKQKAFEGIYLGLWRPKLDDYQLISNDTLSQVMLTGNQNFAILSNEQQYEPQYAYEGLRDFYLVDLSTSKKELFLKKHSGHFLYTIASPEGKYIAYFQDKNWWVYDITKKTHTNITKNSKESFFHNKSEYHQTEEIYPKLGWTLEDKEILLFDEYDLWAISPDGSSSRRLTHGRETQTQFRLARFSNNTLFGNPNYNGWIYNAVDLNKGLFLEATDKKGGIGYYKWSSKSNDKLVFSNNTRLDQIIQSTSGDTLLYREQSYDLSPRLMLLQNNTDKKPQVIAQSNLQQQQFCWGKSELIQYKNAKEKSLQAVLYYPAAYDNQKKYPMIVFIYEKLSKRLHNTYSFPSQFTGEDESFNIATYTTQGYFVLAPDISYEIGDPGISATDCVVSATNEVISQGLVLPKKIGLIGHSFGGYEADFIITQTPLFAAAVAGSAATDLTSFYLTMGWNTGRPDMWRFESQQWRMGKSLFEDRESYDRNSPIVHAKHITTPLLSWTGDDDKQVNWSQSIEFYLALRRLEKLHIMLLYPEEAHTLEKSRNQKDLAVRIHQWFDYHLKDMPPAVWIKTGLK